MAELWLILEQKLNVFKLQFSSLARNDDDNVLGIIGNNRK